MFRTSIWLAWLLALSQFNAWAVTPVLPQQDSDVVEVLPVITLKRPPSGISSRLVADPAAALAAVQQDIRLARSTGDTRYWGRAQATLRPWWGRTDAPPDLAVLQATVQQGRHEFDASRRILVAALKRAPGHAQGWLNLAALERLSARYAEALAACSAVAQAGQALYAQACRLETVSLLGQHRSAAQGLLSLIDQTVDKGRRSWLYSLLAEAHERAGRDTEAADAYRSSLALESDLYTTIAFSDLLLRQGKNNDALAILQGAADTDAVVLRRGAAWRRLGDARWRTALAELKGRHAELKRRGDDANLHARELALTRLWLEDDFASALELARKNIGLQREPVDWWVAMQSALLAGNKPALAEIASGWRLAGLKDARLDAGLVMASSGRQP